MSSSAQAGAGAGGSGDKPPGLSRFMRRASKVLRRSGSKREPPPSAQDDPSAVAAGAAAMPIPEQAVIDPKETTKPQSAEQTTASATTETFTATPSVPAALQQSIRDIKPSTKPADARLARTAAASSAIQEEKARALFAKYGLTLAPGEWTAPVNANAERVEKKIRMRVHRTCHRCQTTFGADKTCGSCNHTRCKKCPRYPMKSSEDGKRKALDIAVDDNAKVVPLTIRSRITGKEMERRVPVQRLASIGAVPSALATRPSSRNIPMATLATEKKWCGHERCNECVRYPPKKAKKEFDEEVIRRVEEKLRNISLSPQASAA
ncbi:MAG: hypothetical protein Q9195_001429 [Heterodermia aff. obscurata]